MPDTKTDTIANSSTAPQKGRLYTLVHNTAALILGRFGSKVLVFLFVRFYTAVLTDVEYGTADLITNLANLLIPLACAGLSSGFFRFVAEAGVGKDQKKVFSCGLAILAVMSGLFLLLSPLLLLWDYFSPYVGLIILYVLVANVHYFCTEYIRGLGKYRLFAVQGLLNTALNILFNLLLLLPFSLGITGYVLSIILADLGATAYVVWRAKLWRAWAPNTVSTPLVRDILRFCIPMIPATVCWWVINVSDRYMVTYFCGDATNGLYTAAYKIPNLLTIAGNVFIEAWQFSAVMENRKRTDLENAMQKAQRQRHVSSFFGRIFCAYAPMLFIMGGAMLMCSKLFAGILFDSSFYEAWVYIPILVTATVFSALSNFVGSVYLVEKKPRLSLLTTAIAALINVLLNLLLIPKMGAMGAAVATLTAYAVLLFVRMVNARRYIPFVCQMPRQIISALLIVLSAVFLSPIGNSFWLAAVFFFFLMLNNVNPLIQGIEKWIAQKKRKNL